MRGAWQARIHEPRGSAPRERDHRGGDHPVPSRTRQLSPPSPRVLQRKAAGGQGVALAEGAFLCAARAERGPQGDRPCGLFRVFGDARRLLSASRGLGRRRRMRDISHQRGCGFPLGDDVTRLNLLETPNWLPGARLLCLFLHCLAFSLEFSFSRVVGRRFDGFDEAY